MGYLEFTDIVKEIKHEHNFPIFNKIKTVPKNLLIEGDNVKVLKLLQDDYTGSTDGIYIDTPYNTGTVAFKFKDKWTHDEWYTFMKIRLELAHPLLKDTGVIFISIDDHEFANLKLLCNFIFGEDNYIGTLIW